MFSWIFKKPGVPAAPVKPVSTSSRPPPQVTPAAPVPRAPRPRPGAGEDWARRLSEAQGDEALLQLAQAAGAPLQTKLEAVGALAGEDALRRAERAFRSHDRKVHRLAKQGLETAVARRQSRRSAQALQSQAEAFLDQDRLPLNLLVELDRAWEALPLALLAPGQVEQFSALRGRLATQVRERSDAEQLAGQRAQQERLAQAHANAAAAAAAAQAAALAAAPPAPVEPEVTASPAAATPQHAAPPAAIDDAQRQRLEDLLGTAEAALAEGQVGELRRHLKAIDALLSGSKGVRVPGALRQRWQALRVEGGRLQGWQQWGGTRARDDLAAEAEALARQAEQERPAATPQAAPAPAVEVLPAHGDAVTETSAAPAAPAAVAPAPAARASRAAPRLNLKAHADSIQALRQRWKELDRLGAAAPAALWQRFDAALQTAYEPVAAQVAVHKAARQENLLAREALLSALEALPVADALAEGNAEATAGRELALELDRFLQAWRRLGPIEHTAPAAAREVLQQRLDAAVGRIERPLQAARAAAVARRESLIAQAQALAPALEREAGREARDGARPAPEAGRQLRELQVRWQEQARQMPLPRGLENGLWTRFKAATDAVFAQRDAMLAAREAELAANLLACETLLARLEALGAQTPLVELERTLAEADQGWRQGGPLPRGALASVEARYASARQAALDLVAAARRGLWQAQCDALAVALAACDASAETGASPRGEQGAAEKTVQTQAAAMPPSWSLALAQRQARAAPGPLAAQAMDDLLLQLESALEMPAAPERQEQLRQLKLRALKQTLEGRSPAAGSASAPQDWLLAALRQRASAPAQQQRLRAIVAALRQAPPGGLAAARPGP